MNQPITASLDNMTNKGFFNYCRSASEMELYNSINASKSVIRKNTAKGFFLNRFGYQPVCIQLHLF